MRGQMVFEFVVAGLLFFAILFYIISVLSSNMALKTEDVERDNLNARMVQLSGFLVKDGNVNAKFINQTCNSGRIENISNFNIITTYPNGSIIENYNGYNLSCGRHSETIGIKRVGILDNKPVIVSFAIW